MADDWKFELKGVKEAMQLLDQKKVITASRLALNRSSAHGRTVAVEEITKDYNIKPARVRSYLKLTARASGYKVWAIITGVGMGLPLGYFDARQSGVQANKKGFRYTKRAKRSGNLRMGGDVVATVKKGGAKVIGPKYGNKPFITRFSSGHIGVWVRKTRKRTPLEQRLGPGVGGLFGTKRIRGATEKAINETFAPEFKRLMELKTGTV
jgi:hypothetical protein